MLEEASYFDIEVKVDPGVLVFIVDTEGAENPIEYVFELVAANIREFQ